jgi:hypothetical protein
MARLKKEVDFKDKETFTHPIFPIEIELPDSIK